MFPFRRLAIRGLQLSLSIATTNAAGSEMDGKDREFHQRRYDGLKNCYLELAALDEVRLSPNKEGCLTRRPNRNPAAAKIRNRLTHPKELRDLEVSDTEIKTLRKAMRWFSDTVLDVAQAHKRGLRPATRQDFAAARRDYRKRKTG
jgi:hypothetical protein